jgi:hypothetical protein
MRIRETDTMDERKFTLPEGVAATAIESSDGMNSADVDKEIRKACHRDS